MFEKYVLFEKKILLFIQNHMRCDILSHFFVFITNIGNNGAVSGLGLYVCKYIIEQQNGEILPNHSILI